MRIIAVCFVAGAVLGAGAAATAETKFDVKPISLNDSATYVGALNDDETFGGGYAVNYVGYGFELSGGQATFLPTPPNCTLYEATCVPLPSAVHHGGRAAGYYLDNNGGTYGFTWQPGAAALTSVFPISSTGCFPCAYPLFSASGNVAFSTAGYSAVGLAAGTYLGLPTALHRVPHLSSGAVAMGLNRQNQLVGTDAPQHGTGRILFSVSRGVLSRWAPPGSAGVSSVAVNDLGEIAGSYVDTAGRWHGFVLMNGKPKRFDMPKRATAITVSGINNKGRVIGFFTEAGGYIYPFLYNGSVVTKIRNEHSAIPPQVAINDFGVMTLGYFDNVLSFYSYRVSCHGAAC